MKTRLLLAMLFVGIVLGSSGCRLPLIDPPIVGRWHVEGGEFFNEYWTFVRDNTGETEYTLSIGGELTFTTDFMWSYRRLETILIKDGVEYKVEYNFFRTEATLSNPDSGEQQVKLTLQSTPVFRM